MKFQIYGKLAKIYLPTLIFVILNLNSSKVLEFSKKLP